MSKDLKKLREMKKDEDNSQTSVMGTIEDENMFLASSEEVAKSKWAMNSTTAKHIYRNRAIFDTLKINRDFDHFILESGDKMKVKGLGSVKVKLDLPLCEVCTLCCCQHHFFGGDGNSRLQVY